MQIAILSDSHGCLETVETALQILKQRGIRVLIHCGDIDDAETVRLFEGFNAHFVYGNCDGLEQVGIQRAVRSVGAQIHQPYGQLELDGKKIAFVHGHEQGLFRQLEKSGQFDFLFHGHTHEADERQVGSTRVINPGALYRADPKSFIVLDLPSGVAEKIIVN